MTGKQKARPRKSDASRADLAAEKMLELNEFELNLVVAINAFNRWIVRCMSTPGVKGLSAIDALVLNCVSRLARRASIAQICSIAQLQERSTVSRSLRRLLGMRLVESRKRGKEVLFSANAAGRELCRRCRITREMLMMATLAGNRDTAFEVDKLTKSLRHAATLYDDATRAASSS